MAKLSHLDAKGKARMVDVGDKPVTAREALARGEITMSATALRLIRKGELAKGDPLQASRLAGIMAAKKTSELIPLCHPLPIESVEVAFDVPPPASEPAAGPVRLRIAATARITARTGVEMEALTAVSVAALTIYDMCKAVDKTMVIDGIRLVSKTGGTKGTTRTEDGG